ncbi:hypothetical protein L6164_028346 [Bauhinia variegata]|uniref:Uncharacterized protein n=1 Tax=Bauhinia variegata TaxID=167791 RepID=A0ACB9LW40_BAUVA|nr:hypothetical protein L6164_028346 [Bauhinia variegata]
MGAPQTAEAPHLYPQELQLKLYQAFIFSIPILFSIILFLLFYLFYLKRRASSQSLSSPATVNNNHPPPPPTAYLSSPCRLDVTLQFLDKLSKILFDEELRARDSQCCVCLGEFELKQELLQIPHCRHLFHIDCIRLWLESNSTCPLCRYSIFPTTKLLNPALPLIPDPVHRATPSQQVPENEVAASSTAAHFSRE